MDPTALFRLSYGVYIVTSWHEGTPAGCVANSAMQITSSPATIAVSVNKQNFTHAAIEDCGYFALSALSEKSDPKLIGKFGFTSSRDTDKFAGTPYAVKGKLPVILDSVAYFCCKVVAKWDTPTHTVFLGEVYDAEVLHGGTPMTYAYYHKVLKGKTSVNAPTYVKEDKKGETGARYVCTVCGYEYDGDVPFEDLPEDWVCPLCGVGKDMFKKIGGETVKKYRCRVCGYEYDGKIPFEELPDDWVCPLCGEPKSAFEEIG